MDVGYALAAARRHWVMLLVLVLVGIGGGLAHAFLATTTYRSTTTVLFSLSLRGSSINEAADGSNYVQDLVPSYAKVAEMPAVLNPVIQQLGLDLTPAQLAEKIEVTLKPASVVLQIAVEDGDRQVAANIANKIADLLTSTISTLSPRSSANTAAIQVITLAPAAPAEHPFAPNKRLSVALGLALGLLAGLAGVAVRESIATPPLATRKDLARVSDEVPVLGSIVTDPRSAARPIPVSTHSGLPRAESFRMLQTNLTGLERQVRVFAVTSPQSGDGRTSTAVNLAIALAHTSLKTLLVDADLRGPGIAQLLGLDSGGPGLTNVLRGRATAEEATRTWVTQLWGNWNLDILTSGPEASNPSEMLASPAMATFLENVRGRYDVVVLDTPPLLQSTDGSIVSAQVDGALVLVDGTRTKERHLVEALGRLHMAGADVLGLALNRATGEAVTEYSVGGRSGKPRGERQREADTPPGSPLAAPPARPAAAAAAVPPQPSVARADQPQAAAGAQGPPPDAFPIPGGIPGGAFRPDPVPAERDPTPTASIPAVTPGAGAAPPGTPPRAPQRPPASGDGRGPAR